MENEKTFSERVKEQITQVTPNKEVLVKFPRSTFKRFDSWSFENASGCYWLAIEKLMDNYDNKILWDTEMKILSDRDDIIMSEIGRLQAEMDVLKNELNNKPKISTVRKHFGEKNVE